MFAYKSGSRLELSRRLDAEVCFSVVVSLFVFKRAIMCFILPVLYLVVNSLTCMKDRKVYTEYFSSGIR